MIRKYTVEVVVERGNLKDDPGNSWIRTLIRDRLTRDNVLDRTQMRVGAIDQVLDEYLVKLHPFVVEAHNEEDARERAVQRLEDGDEAAIYSIERQP